MPGIDEDAVGRIGKCRSNPMASIAVGLHIDIDYPDDGEDIGTHVREVRQRGLPSADFTWLESNQTG
jgi:hypothetical protein